MIIPEHARRRTDEDYAHLLDRLCRSSVTKHFDAYADIAWDSAEFQIDPGDSRWERNDDDPLGATHWYKSRPQAERALIGLHAVVGHMKIGIEFESVLKRGLLDYASTLPSGAPEFRYVYHEVIEEAQHSLMFQEMINRSGLDAPGLSRRHRAASRRVASLGRKFPELFFVFVLGGEEPIDHVQRVALKQHDVHPLLRRMMQIHVTEEARHLCFAREYLRKNVPRLSNSKMWRLRVAVPIILGQMAKLMMQPPQYIIDRYGIPDDVVREAYIDSPLHERAVLDSLNSVTALCKELNIVTPMSTRIWRRMRIWDAAGVV